jgi:VanZ family protein
LFTLGLGSGAASMSETSRFIRPLLEFLFPNADADTLYLYHAAIRKLAHIFQYGILGLLAHRAFSALKRPFVLALCYVAVVAITDEVHQSYDPSRTATPFDVLIDLVGAFLALRFSSSFAAFGGTSPSERRIGSTPRMRSGPQPIRL